MCINKKRWEIDGFALINFLININLGIIMKGRAMQMVNRSVLVLSVEKNCFHHDCKMYETSGTA